MLSANLVLDVGWLVISRFILLDSMLLFFTFLTVFCLTRFHNEQYDPFSIDWWAWLVFTGISIGLVTRYVSPVFFHHPADHILAASR